MKKALFICVYIFLSILSLSAIAAPGDTLYSESFNGNLNDWTVDNSGGGEALISNATADQGRALALRWDVVSVTSANVIDTSVPGAEISVWVRRGDDSFSEDPDSGENLIIEYLNDSGFYTILETFTGSGTAGEIFNRVYTLPTDGLHTGLRLRFRHAGGNGSDFDYWHIDTLEVTEATAVVAPLVCQELFAENFDTNLNNWVVDNSGGGDAGIGNETVDSGSSLRLRWNTVTVTNTSDIDTSPNDAQLSVWIRRGDDSFSENPDGNENLVIEYLNDSGSYIALETFIGGGTTGEIFNRVYTLPSDGLHSGLRLRFRQAGGSGSDFDYWHVDSVSVEETVPSLNPDGSANSCSLNGVVAEYRFDESLWDGTTDEVVENIGSGLDGTANGGVTTITQGQVCRAGQFDGVDDFVVVNGIDSTLQGTASLAFWIRTTQTGPSDIGWQSPGVTGVEISGGTSDVFWGWINNTGRIGVGAGDGGHSQSTTTINDGNWHHVVHTRDATSGEVQTYIDGVFENTSTSGAGVVTGSFSSLGRIEDTGGTPEYLQGDLDEVLVFNEVIDAADVQTIYNNQLAGNNVDGSTRTCPVPPIDHYAISHSGIGITCEAEPITIIAHDASDVAVAPGSGTTINILTSDNQGDWLIDTSAAGTFTNNGAGSASYQFAIGETGVLLYLAHITPVVSLDIDISDGTFTDQDGVSEDDNLDFVEAALRFTSDASSNSIATQLSGKNSNIAPNNQAHTLRAIRTDNDTGACIAAIQGTTNVDLAYECRNPTTCISGQTLTLAGGPIASNSNGSVAAYTTVPLTFDATGSAPLSILNYSDAGLIRLHALTNLPADSSVTPPQPAITLTGTSNEFVVKPAGLCVEAPELISSCVLVDETCSVFRRAGEIFDLTISGRTWELGDVSNEDFCLGGNAVTPNYVSNNAVGDAITLSSSLLAPSGGVESALTVITTNIVSSVINPGSVPINNQAFPEVGIITITATPPAYLNGETITASSSAEIGRFIPSRFVLSNGAVTEACTLGATFFTYMGQSFQISYDLAAVNTADVVTRNYAGSFALLSDLSDVGAVDTGLGVDLSSRLSLVPTLTTLNWLPVGDPMAGESIMSTSILQFNRAAGVVIDGPYTIDIGVSAVDDNDTVAASDDVVIFPDNLDVDGDSVDDYVSIDTGANNGMRYGRMVVQNAFGPETRELPVPVIAEYFNGTKFVTNSDDNCTAIIAGDAILLNPVAPILTGDTSIIGVVSTPLNNGASGLVLAEPNKTGSIDIQLTVPTYLQSDWDSNGAADNDPINTADFGTYRSNDRIIYRQEVLQ